MQERYTLGTDKIEFVVADHFPAVQQNIGVFLSGGMESTLIAAMCIELYGKDKVKCFYSDRIFSNNNDQKNRNIVGNIKRAAEILGLEPIFFDVDYDLHMRDRKQSVDIVATTLKTTYGAEYLLFGFTHLFFEVEPFKIAAVTEQDIINIAFAEPYKYRHVIDEFHLKTGRYASHLLDIDIPPEVFPALRGVGDVMLSPFDTLNKSDVVDLYDQLGWTDLLFKTSSCIQDTLLDHGVHCGRCFNCQQRYDAFRILNKAGIVDKTEYLYTDIVYHRQEIEELNKAA